MNGHGFAPPAPVYVEDCYSVPRNVRVGGARNPDYSRCSCSTTTIRASAPTRRVRSQRRPASIGTRRPPAWRAWSATRRGTTRRWPSWRSPRSATLLETWRDQYLELGARPEVRHVLTFENKGEVVGVINPHPHGQIYATNFVFKTIEMEAAVSRRYHRGARPRALPRHHPRRAGGRTPDALRERVGDRLSFRTSRATRTRATSRRARRTPASPTMTPASCTIWRRRCRRTLVRIRQSVAEVVSLRDDAASGADRRRRLSAAFTSTSRSIRRCGSPTC